MQMIMTAYVLIGVLLGFAAGMTVMRLMALKLTKEFRKRTKDHYCDNAEINEWVTFGVIALETWIKEFL